MTRRVLATLVFLGIFAVIMPAAAVPAQGTGPGSSIYLPMIRSGFAVPLLRWQRGGCYSSWCETGWYSSPAVADVNGDGKNEVIASAYSLFALNGDTGALVWRAGGTANRTWPGVIIADIDQDGKLDVVTAQSGGYVSMYTLAGTLKWQKQPAGASGEFRGALAADLEDNGGPLEIVVTRASGSATNTWVLDAAGNALAGKWPQMSDGSGYAWGVYNANPAAGDLRADLPGLELVVPSDVHYINAYDKRGNSLAANAADYPGKTWGKIGVWESLATEKRGWGACDGTRAESYRANFADGPALIADVNQDGAREVISVGNMYDCAAGYPPSRYAAPFIFNADRSRFNSAGFDWRSAPVDTGAPLSEDYTVIESYQPNPVAADLDGDGNLEILFSSYDGRVHAYWLDKTEHASWPFSLVKPGVGGIRFASEPLVADLDNDGQAEVIFTSWVQIGSGLTGKLHILSSRGQVISETALPPGVNSDWNGGMAAPTLAKIGSPTNYAVIVNTTHSGVVVYDLPGITNPRIQWGTGRGDYSRKASR